MPDLQTLTAAHNTLFAIFLSVSTSVRADRQLHLGGNGSSQHLEAPDTCIRHEMPILQPGFDSQSNTSIPGHSSPTASQIISPRPTLRVQGQATGSTTLAGVDLGSSPVTREAKVRAVPVCLWRLATWGVAALASRMPASPPLPGRGPEGCGLEKATAAAAVAAGGACTGTAVQLTQAREASGLGLFTKEMVNAGWQPRYFEVLSELATDCRWQSLRAQQWSFLDHMALKPGAVMSGC